MFQNKIFQASVIVAIILVSSAVFLSQADKITGKAQSAAITGTMVLFDQNIVSGSAVLLNKLYYEFYLPTASCTGIVNYCSGASSPDQSECTSVPINQVAGRKYSVRIGGMPVGDSIRCEASDKTGRSAKMSNMHSELLRFTCYTWGSSTSSSYMYSEARYLGPDKISGTADDKVICSINDFGVGDGQTDVILRYPIGSNFSCSATVNGGNLNPGAFISEQTNPLGVISHLSVSYECT